jgi:hypothetical protein
MTAGEFFRVLIRRWYVLGLFAVITVVMVGLASRTNGLYWTQVDVVFLPPSNFNLLQDHTDGVVQFAAVIEREFNGNRGGVPPTLPGGTLYGEGITRGYDVTLLNSGTQWGNNFNRQVISVEVVDSTPSRVDAVVKQLTTRIDALVIRQQDAVGVAPKNRIETYELPARPVISHVQGSRVRADIAIAALGAALGAVASVLIDRLLRRVGALPPRGAGGASRSRRRETDRALQRDPVDVV